MKLQREVVGLEDSVLADAPTLPKSADRIRSALAGVHETVTHVEAGPLQAGSPANLRIVGAAYRSKRAAELVCELLRAKGVSAKQVRYGDQWKVEIPRDQSEAVEKVLSTADLSIVNLEERDAIERPPFFINCILGLFVAVLVVPGFAAALLLFWYSMTGGWLLLLLIVICAFIVFFSIKPR